VNVEPANLMLNEIMNRYNEQPTGWIVLTDFKGNILILGPNEAYRLKTLPINPQEHIGVGVKIDTPHEIRRRIEGAPPYGFRIISSKQFKKLTNRFSNTESQSKLLSKILNNKTLSTWEIETKGRNAVLSGPVIAHPDLSTISKSQRQLDLKLTIEAGKLFRKKYPNRAAIYG